MSKPAFKFPEFEPGSVWLVGAGPGDPGLLTLHAAEAIQRADVIVYDALVSQSVLDLVPGETTLESAGKRGGTPSPKQADITLRLIQLAREGKRVLRLKGGDPFVFGRGGEEALGLVAAGIPFRIVPGITAGIGGLAYAGIPATHRDTNHIVTLVTGHDASGEIAGIDWEALARGSQVLVLYMALKHLSEIRARLLSGGRRPEEPLAVVRQATTQDQQVLVTTLGDCIDDVAEAGIQPPALVVLGEVVRLREGLDWLSALDGRALNPDPLATPFKSSD